jgi:hypothetical protein
MRDGNSRGSTQRLRIIVGLIVAVLGLLIFILGAAPGMFGMDRSQVTGFVQITVFLIGLGLICLGGIFSLNALWNGRAKGIAADIGYRLVATAYVISVASGFADVFGFGSQRLPLVPYFGPLQAFGVIIGQVVILIGFFLMVPYPGREAISGQQVKP